MATLSVLMENTAVSGDFQCEHGLSFFIETEGAAVLFDAGPSGAFLKNAELMGCNVAAATHIVLSHGHYDHTGGLRKALRHIAAEKGSKNLPPVVAHPGVTARRRKSLGLDFGYKELGMPADALRELAAWPSHFVTEPLFLTETLVFLGEIPKKHTEMCVHVGEADHNGEYEPDTLPDDSALAYITDSGLVVIAGCSHSGIVNILEHAKNVTGVTKICAIYGGLHCKDMDDETLAAVKESLSAENVDALFACHCTGNALDSFPGQTRLAAGERLTIG